MKILKTIFEVIFYSLLIMFMVGFLSGCTYVFPSVQVQYLPLAKPDHLTNADKNECRIEKSSSL